MRDQNRDGERLAAVFLVGIALINPLLIQIFDGGADAAVFGIPILYLYLFAGWAVLIALKPPRQTGPMSRVTWRGKPWEVLWTWPPGLCCTFPR